MEQPARGVMESAVSAIRDKLSSGTTLQTSPPYGTYLGLDPNEKMLRGAMDDPSSTLSWDGTAFSWARV